MRETRAGVGAAASRGVAWSTTPAIDDAVAVGEASPAATGGVRAEGDAAQERAAVVKDRARRDRLTRHFPGDGLPAKTRIRGIKRVFPWYVRRGPYPFVYDGSGRYGTADAI